MISDTMQTIAIAGPERVDLRTAAVPKPPYGHILVRTAFVGICGTDLHLYRGHSFYLESGLLRFPFVFGHEYTGTVVEAAEGVTAVAPGDRVVGHCMVPCRQCDTCQSGRPHLCRNLREVGLRGIQGAAADFVCVPASAVTRLPEGLSARAATLVEPCVTAYHACERARITPADRVAVIGTGTLGLLAFLVARLSARSVDVIGVEASELAFAKELGATRTLRPEDAAEAGYDVVIESSGVRSALAQSIRLADAGGRISLIGLPSGSSTDVDQTAIALKDLTIHGILHGLDYYGRVVDLFASGRIDAARLVAGIGKPAAAADLFARLLQPGRKAPKYLIEFAGE